MTMAIEKEGEMLVRESREINKNGKGYCKEIKGETWILFMEGFFKILSMSSYRLKYQDLVSLLV